MITKIKIFGLLVLTSLLFSCQKNNPIRDFGKWKSIDDSLRVDLNLVDFDSLPQLLERIEDISCNDSFPAINIKNKKRIYLRNSCMRGIACRLIKGRNILEIENDSIKKQWLEFPIDSLENILNRDYHNNGRNGIYSDRPNKLLIRVSTDSDKINKIDEKLDILTDLYQKVSDKQNIKVEITRIKRKPLPPPPYHKKINVEFDE